MKWREPAMNMHFLPPEYGYYFSLALFKRLFTRRNTFQNGAAQDYIHIFTLIYSAPNYPI